MKRLHSDLCERHPWYNRWHRLPNISTIHFVILIGVCVISVSTIRVANYESSLLAAVTGAPERSVSVGTLTSELLKVAKQYQTATTLEEQSALLEKLTQVAISRRDLMLTLNPRNFLLAALPPG